MSSDHEIAYLRTDNILNSSWKKVIIKRKVSLNRFREFEWMTTWNNNIYSLNVSSVLCNLILSDVYEVKKKQVFSSAFDFEENIICFHYPKKGGWNLMEHFRYFIECNE